jgi:hypothetical protein
MLLIEREPDSDGTVRIDLELNWPGDASSNVKTTGDVPEGMSNCLSINCETLIGRYPRSYSSLRSRRK